MTTAIFIIFCTVYLGMILGGLPFLQLDRTGIALLGAIALIGVEAVSPEEAAKSIHLPTLILLFSFMVVSAQMRLGGFYAWVTRRLAALPLSPPTLLAALIAVVAALSAVFSNDIVCLAVAPVLIEACLARRLDPVPYLLAAGVNLERPGPLFAATLVLSNVVSNVPAVMLLLPVAEHALAGPTLALVSTLSGNLLIVGSIANIIVVNAAARRGIRMHWRRHARTGVPVTLATLAICAASLWWRMPPAV